MQSTAARTVSEIVREYYFEPWTEQSKQLQKRLDNNKKNYRLLINQDDLEEFESWGAIHIEEGFDSKLFRRRLSKLASKANLRLICFEDTCQSTNRTKFRFITTQLVERKELKEVFQKAAGDFKTRLFLQDVPTRRIQKRKLFAFLSKSTVRSVVCSTKESSREFFTVGKILSSSAEKLRKLTENQIRWRLFFAMSKDAELAFRVARGEFSQKILLDAKFIWKWNISKKFGGQFHKVEKANSELELVERYIKENSTKYIEQVTNNTII